MRSQMMVYVALAMTLALSCKEDNTQGGKLTVDDLGPVMERHAEELMKLPGVTGVAVGALDDGTPCILVLVLEDTEQIRSGVPKTVEGHTVKILVSGTIEPLSTDSSG